MFYLFTIHSGKRQISYVLYRATPRIIRTAVPKLRYVPVYASAWLGALFFPMREAQRVEYSIYTCNGPRRSSLDEWMECYMRLPTLPNCIRMQAVNRKNNGCVGGGHFTLFSEPLTCR